MQVSVLLRMFSEGGIRTSGVLKDRASPKRGQRVPAGDGQGRSSGQKEEGEKIREENHADSVDFLITGLVLSLAQCPGREADGQSGLAQPGLLRGWGRDVGGPPPWSLRPDLERRCWRKKHLSGVRVVTAKDRGNVVIVYSEGGLMNAKDKVDGMLKLAGPVGSSKRGALEDHEALSGETAVGEGVFWTVNKEHLPKLHQLEPRVVDEWRPMGAVFLKLLGPLLKLVRRDSLRLPLNLQHPLLKALN
ncbi:hypothetical protein H920_04677 [Fukomys damarensis]|uniref:Uncharacterized protein n=1 Tax=Fukomys damarensis TaxID=885580 RepID=A0A091DS41_FUKDA|nr:hypothetical protein H920_04677 [Fukomys damarensis]